MLPNVDEIDIFNVDIASPQNMYPEDESDRHFIIKFNFKFGP